MFMKIGTAIGSELGCSFETFYFNGIRSDIGFRYDREVHVHYFPLISFSPVDPGNSSLTMNP